MKKTISGTMSKPIVYINKMRPKSLGKHFHNKKKIKERCIYHCYLINHKMCLAITEFFFVIFYAFCDNVMFDFVVKWRQGGATV